MATPDCKKILNLLPLYIDDMLSFAEADEVKRHLDLCDDCRKESDYLKAIMKKTKEIKAAEPPAGFCEKLIEKVQTAEVKKKKRRIILRHISKFAAAAAVVAFCVVALGELKNDENIDIKNQHATLRMMPDNLSSQEQNEDILKIPASRSVKEEINAGTVVTVTVTEDSKDAVLEILSLYEKDEFGYIVSDTEEVLKKITETGASVEINTDNTKMYNYIIIK